MSRSESLSRPARAREHRAIRTAIREAQHNRAIYIIGQCRQTANVGCVTGNCPSTALENGAASNVGFTAIPMATPHPKPTQHVPEAAVDDRKTVNSGAQPFVAFVDVPHNALQRAG